MRAKPVLALSVVVLLLGACGGGNTPTVADDEPVLQIVSEGGFVPLEFALGNGPRFTILGDGSLIYQGPQIEIFPSPLLPNYQVTTLSESQLSSVLAMVEEIGLPDIDDETDNEAANFVADASTEVITFWDETGDHRLAVYALGIEDEPSARNVAFLDLIETLEQFTGVAESHEYVAERVRVLAGEAFVDPEFEDTRDWPLPGSDPATWDQMEIGWSCTIIDGPVPEVFETATSATAWTPPDGSGPPMKLIVRPLLPGEPDCP